MRGAVATLRGALIALILSTSTFVGAVAAQVGPGGAIPPLLEGALRQTGSRRNAETRIQKKWDELQGAPGRATTPGESGLVVTQWGYYREYADGLIYYRPSDAYPFWVHGSIHEKYRQLGGPASRLGWPTSDQQGFPESGQATTFEGGTIYWWADTGAIELGNIVLSYTGLYCFGETDESSESDEPYLFFGVLPPPPAKGSVMRTVIYEEVDSGDSREDNIELYRGLPSGIMFDVVLMEHDIGNPEKEHALVKKGVDAGAEKLIELSGEIPEVGPAVAVVLSYVWSEVGTEVVGYINDALGFEDDKLDAKPMVVTARQMVTLARAARQNLSGIEWQIDSPLLSGDGGSYKAYFTVASAEPPVTAVPFPAPPNPTVPSGTFEPSASYQPVWIYGIQSNGELYWYRRDSSGWHGKKRVGTGWQFKDVIPAGGNSLYALTEEGRLLWYQHTGFNDGSNSWQPAKEVGHGWAFEKIFSGGEGVIYAITADGKLMWYKHNGYQTGAGLETPGAWEGAKQVGRGWTGFDTVFSGGGGVIYAITTDGKLMWYKHNGYLTGAGLETPGAWEARKQVGRGWTGFRQVLSGGDGVILAIEQDGKLRWYRHNGYKTGAGLETPGAWSDFVIEGTGWNSYEKVLALLPSPSASNVPR